MNQPCRHAKTCQARLADGDMDGGCNSDNEKDCLSAKIQDRRYYKDSLLTRDVKKEIKI
jgi:hypothetical protein